MMAGADYLPYELTGHLTVRNEGHTKGTHTRFIPRLFPASRGGQIKGYGRSFRKPRVQPPIIVIIVCNI
jgi:hypothetical protein